MAKSEPDHLDIESVRCAALFVQLVDPVLLNIIFRQRYSFVSSIVIIIVFSYE